ncbi:hypothetical protein ABPG74_010447 [Tetrahymena malaccensis]
MQNQEDLYQQKQQLIQRLYRNSSQNSLSNPLPGLRLPQGKSGSQRTQRNESTIIGQGKSLNTSMANRYMLQESELVPKIVKYNKLPPLQDTSSLPVIFNKGKILVNSTKNFGSQSSLLIGNILSTHNQQNSNLINFNQSSVIDQSSINILTNPFPHNRSVKHLDQINRSQLSINAQRILDDVNLTKDSIPQQDQKLKDQEAQKNKKTHFRIKKGQKQKKNKEDDGSKMQDYLTPMDFIHLIRTDPEMADEFCYLNKNSNPYDFKIVEFDARNPKEYMTISARGITHFIDDQAEFKTIEEWERESKMFHQLLEIEFFKQYKKWKNFSLWKKLMRRNMMRECSHVLSQQLFSVDRNLQPALLEIRGLCLMSQEFRYMEMNINQPLKYEEFKKTQESYRVTATDYKLDKLENGIKELVMSNCKRSLQAFKEENRIPSNDANDTDELKEKAPLLVGDETGKEMPYTQEATIRTHYKRLNKFVRLVDYLIVDSKIQMINNSTSSIVRHIEDLNDSIGDKYQSVNSMIIVEASNIGPELVFTPNRDILRKMFEEIISKSVQRICNKHKMLVNVQELRDYIRIEDSEDRNGEDSIDLYQIVHNDGLYKQSQVDILNVLNKAFDFVEEYSKILIPFIQIFINNSNINWTQVEQMENEYFKKMIEQFREEDNKFQSIEPNKELGLIFFDNIHLKDKIKNISINCLTELTKMMPDLLFKKAKNFYTKLHAFNQKIALAPVNVEQFVQYNEYISEISNNLEEMTSENAEITELLFLIEEYKIKLPESYKAKVKEASQQIQTLRTKISDAQASADQNSKKFQKQLDSMIPGIKEDVKELEEQLIKVDYAKVEANINQTCSQIQEISNRLAEIVKQSKKINDFQIAMQLELTIFEKMDIFVREFGMIEKLWMSRKEWKREYDRWDIQPFFEIDLDDLSNKVEKLGKAANHCAKEMETNEVARIFKNQVEEFRNVLSLLQSLRDPALQEKWDDVRSLIKENRVWEKEPFHDIKDPMYTLGWINKYNLVEYKDKVAEIALKAAKEAELNKMYKGVEAFWTMSQLTVNSYKDRQDASILGNNDDLIAKLDDALLTVNNILASRFVESIATKVEAKQKSLRQFQELMDEWMLHQRNWLYLEPILTSPYAVKTMAKEVKSFNNADAQWKRIMKAARDNPQLRRFNDELIKTTLTTLRNNNAAFEIIQKALDELLEKKREIFQRFFFLSNDELLEILSQAKNIKSVIPHLRKCFENIVKLEFDHLDTAVGMISAEGEKVVLKGYQARGEEVENWFKDLEEAMKNSLRYVMRSALLKYDDEDTQRSQWVISFPSQVVLALDAIYWTKITEENYLSPESDGDLYDWLEGQMSQLEELTTLIRGDLTELQRKTLSALAVQDVHYRDIIEELAQEGVESTTEFKWQQQLRFYIEDESIWCKQVNAKLPYGYEYLGASPRLVITPLTDRCWMTITGALGIKLGAAPAGPAGTGKTESCKDLAKALGKYCIVFNCSEQINVKMMEKLFMGLCYTGSWTCLDEFNRIDIEVLSVIAQQVLTIREAHLRLAASSGNDRQFNFFGKMVTLALTADMGIFTTMNPGYAGRTELPDNLKVLFRPVAMMVPDYALIAEIMLFAEGFSNAKDLSRKMTKLYTLSSEQLSQQDHYDFGMRAVKSVLVMAGALKRAEPNISEDIVLIRAMRDSNVPKFLSHDIPLFNAIVQDLFPGLDIPPIQNKQLEDVIKQNISNENLVPCNTFIEKVLQFHETLKVRFGVMVVGPTMGGKSKVIDVLRLSYCELNNRIRGDNEKTVNNHPDFQNIQMTVLNPKSISMEELYGDFDPLSQSWTDGLASTIMRQYVSLETTDKRWVIFDGPVDALWIENMNTVLDDSMTLCLSNGERIKLKPQLRMLFEVQDLAVASPATVSRCGMVYIDQDVVGYEAIVESYFQKEIFPLLKKDQHKEQLKNNFNISFKKILNHMKKKKISQTIPTVEANIAISVCRNIKLILELDQRDNLENENSKKAIDKLLLWAIGWGIGATVSTLNIKEFQDGLSEAFTADISPRGSLFEYYYTIGKGEGDFIAWSEIIPEFSYAPEMSYFQLVVPTTDTVCYSWFLDKNIQLLHPIFLTGLTGTGKTIITSSTLNTLKDQNTVATCELTFSAKTSSLSTQGQIENKLQTQRKNKKVILMPPPGRKLVVFIDDINMPSVEIYGAQPPIELLRQFMDYKGLYDRKTLQWKQIDSTVLIAAAAPPGGGRSSLTARFTRHFSIMTVPDSQAASLTHIFSSIFNNFLRVKKFRKEITELGENESVVNATLNIYRYISEELLPTPSKQHYVFNLRDVSKVFQGLLLAKPHIILNVESLVKLWIHEMSRVFCDRLINEQDRNWFMDTIQKQLFINFKLDWKKEDVFNEVPLIFSDFMKRNIEFEDRVYEEAKDFQRLTKIIEEYMNEDTKLQLILFKDAVEHMSRIARVLSLQRGHFMIVGVGGSGKKSITTLASALAGCELDSIEPKKQYGKKEFKEDLLRMMKKVGIENKRLTFLFADTQILQEGFLEDVNNLLNSGEVPNMLQKDEVEDIIQQLSQEAREHKISDIYQYFVEKVRSQMHIVLALSPVGNALRVRMRMFPSIVNCCTIDWLNPWPQEALMTVAKMFLENLEFEGLTKERKEQLSECCVYVHQSVEEMTETYFKNLKRRVYITPKSYIDLIESYKQLIKMKQDQLESQKNKLSNGLYKLKEANDTIASLKEKLTELQPVLQKKTIEQDELIKKLEADSYEANKVRSVVKEEEAQVNEKASEIREMKVEADKVLQAALPMLQAANEALNILDRKVISEIKANNNPNELVLFTLQCVCCLFDEKQDWDSIKKLLADPNLVSRMKNLDVYNISPKVEKNIKAKIATNENFNPQKLATIQAAAKAICEWVIAVANFTDVNKQIQSKKNVVDKMNQELDKANKELSVKQAELQKVEDKVAKLEKEYNDNKLEKDRLDKEIQTTADRLVRAEELTQGLADEQIRWKETVGTLGDQIKLLVGDVFVAGASVTYYGPFTGTYREDLVKQWLQKCEDMQIPKSENYVLENVLGDPVEIRNWNAKGLPSDSVSINNGILVHSCRNYPLLIDPQLQASKWIKNLNSESNMMCTKMSDEKLFQTLEVCIRMGQPLMIEDMEDTLDTILEPLLLKQFTINNRRKMIKVGDADVEFDNNFKLYIQTKSPNPNFLPEIFIRVTVINFTVTELGLEEQLLGDVVRKEMPEVELTKNELIISIAQGKTQLKKNEDRILELLTSSKGMILDDVELIENLKLSKKTSEIVKEKITEAEEKKVEIEEARSQYKPVAQRGSYLYFVIADLALIDPMYQFSLAYFSRLFNLIIENSEKSPEINQRVDILINSITQTIFLNVCRGLFNDHKRIFSFLVSATIQQRSGIITKQEWNLFCRGAPILKEKPPAIPQGLQINQKTWNSIFSASQVISNFGTWFQNLKEHAKEWDAWINCTEPFTTPFPKQFKGEITPFQRLILVRLLREEKSLYAMTYYVEQSLGSKFSSNNAAVMEEVYKDTDYKTPLIFILSQGADPLLNLLRFAKDMKISSEKLVVISLGQGQGPIAQKAIENGLKNGGWVVLQNCHLGKSFMPKLEELIAGFNNEDQEFNTEFRLFLTSMPCDYFPISILQNGVKLTNEPPKGIKSNIQKSYAELSEERFESCTKEKPWKKLLYSISFFHAIIQERRKFGPLGWNIRYEFNDSDLDTSITILRDMLEVNEEIPWDALRYVIGQITYGGRVTDDWDRRTLMAILNSFLNEEVLLDTYKFSESGIYMSSKIGKLKDYKSLIEKYPAFESPEVFGMHENANITFQLKESKIALDTILNMQPRENTASGEGQKTPDQIIEEMCNMFEERLPPPLKKEVFTSKKPETIDSLQVCMNQECERFNKLLSVMKQSLSNLKKAIKGEVVMSAELDKTYTSMMNNTVPEMWKARSYPSLKPLQSWFDDLVKRTEFFRQWLNLDGKPKVYWLPAFFFPQGFLTSVLQNFARQNKIAIDVLNFGFKFTKYTEPEQVIEMSITGAYIYGLFIEGCQFDVNKGILEDSNPGVMYTSAPVIEFVPNENYQSKQEDYRMPVYKTTSRAGTLSTTGHSTNFIIGIDTPTKKKPEYWILKGAAYTCALND